MKPVSGLAFDPETNRLYGAVLADRIDELDDPAVRPRATQLARTTEAVLCSSEPEHKGCPRLRAFLAEAEPAVATPGG